jgi:aspartate kinase
MSFEKEHIKVAKIGGTSMNNMDQVEAIDAQESADAHTVFVVSAFGGVTDKLLVVADEIMPFGEHPNKRAADATAFEPFVADTLQRIRSAVSEKDGADLSHVEAFLRRYIDDVLRIVPLYVEQLMFTEQEEKALLKEVFRDRIISIGEIFSAHALSVVLTARSSVGKVYEDVDTANVIARPPNGLNIYPRKGKDKLPLYKQIGDGIGPRVIDLLQNGRTPIVPGYVGIIPGAITNTIDRGYSDTTGAIIARALDDRLVVNGTTVSLQIWKEVPGLLSADPRLVEPGYDPKTFVRAADFKVALLRDTVTFRETAQLSLGGMKAINQNGIPALDGSNVRLSVRNTYDIQSPGTTVIPSSVGKRKEPIDESLKGIRFVSGKKGQTMFTIESDSMVAQDGVAADIFSEARTLGVSVNATTDSPTSLSICVDTKDPNIKRLEGKLRLLGQVERQDNLAIISCIGNSLRGQKGLLTRLSGVLSAGDINIEFDGGDKENNVTFIVNEGDYDSGVKALHKELFESEG